MTSAEAPRFTLRRLAPVGILAAGVALFFAFDLDAYFGFESLRAHRVELVDFVAARPTVAALAYMLLYATVVSCFLPGAAALTIAGGFLFGTVLATGLTVIGATVGAVVVFLIARTALGEPLRARAGPWVKRMADGFRANAFNYLLVLRLVPLFPFFVVNFVPALLGVPLRTFAVATFVGIVPGTFVFASVGAGIGSVLESNEAFSVASVLTTDVVVALTGLALLAVIPVGYRALRRRF